MTLTPNYCTLHSPSSMALERSSHIKNIYPCSPTSLWDMTLFYDIAISKDLNLGETKKIIIPTTHHIYSMRGSMLSSTCKDIVHQNSNPTSIRTSWRTRPNTSFCPLFFK